MSDPRNPKRQRREAPLRVMSADDLRAEQKNRPERTYLKKLHPHPRDKYVTFQDEGHIYSVAWAPDQKLSSEGIRSTTGLIAAFFHKFDQESALRSILANPNHRKYKGMNRDEILAQWKQISDKALAAGTQLHERVEDWYNHIHHDVPRTPEFGYFLEYDARVKAKGWCPFRTEWQLWSTAEFRLAGMIDMIYIHRDPKRHALFEDGRWVLVLIMADWKRWKYEDSRNKEKRWPPKPAKKPYSHLPSNDYAKYQLQLNVYRHMLETWYGGMVYRGRVYDAIRIESMELVVMHPLNRQLHVLPVPRRDVTPIFDLARQQVQSWESKLLETQ